jgi:hypothetical protein
LERGIDSDGDGLISFAEAESIVEQEFQERSPELFEKRPKDAGSEVDLEKLYAKIGQLEMENDFLKKYLKKTGL